MKNRTSVIVTSISKPNKVLHSIAKGCGDNGLRFVVVGDISSPEDFHIDNCSFYSLEKQEDLDLKYPGLCPVRHYARKNIGYLIEMLSGAEIIIDTDDDNFPYDSFWNDKNRVLKVPIIETQGWVNIYRYFTDELIWPRGLPLNTINNPVEPYDALSLKTVDCPIQQGLADSNPDVDAVFRLINPSKSIAFDKTKRLALSKGAWCPFNSQNTVWWRDAFPLLYLPSYCSFRMTDIIRSFVAQRIAWENEWSILFHGPTVWQERNEHDLIKDFQDEIPGYLFNEKMCIELEKLMIKKGPEHLTSNLRTCYEKLAEINIVDRKEIELVETWIGDIERAGYYTVK